MSSGCHSHFCYNFDVCLFVCWHWHVNQQLFPTLHSAEYWTNYGKVAHVLYEFFQALFKFGNNFFKKCIFWPPGARFLKTPKIFEFFEKHIPGGVAHVLYAFFKALFSSENIFQKTHFWALLGPLFWKP